jgi:hypothetical protein
MRGGEREPVQFYASEGERKEKGISLFEAFLAKKGVK